MRWPGPFTVVAVSFALALVLNLATDTVEVDPPWWKPAVWAALAVLVVATVLIEWTRARAARESTVDPTAILGQAADDLAEAVASQWRAEVNARGLGHLDPIRMRWSATSRPVTPAPAELLDAHHRPAPPVKVRRLRLSGDLADMTRTLAQLPIRQLVVIGSPGAGKSTLAVLLTLALLQSRQSGAPVPVLMTVSSWDPDREHLDAWLVRRLGELYPALSRRGRYGKDAAVRLVERGLVIPILDGLDEMPEPVRARAVKELTVAVGRDRSLVLTSRADEYQAAVSQAGSPLARAAVVEIEPVTAADAAVYLTAGQIDGEARWNPVLAHLAAYPDGALARTLRTPLMVYLARTAYHTPGTDPAALLAFTDSDAIERHLLDAYLPAVYAPRTAPPRTQHTPAAAPTYTAQQAHRWLAFLADHLTREQTTDFAWWRLHRAISHYFWRAGGLGFGILVGLMVGFLLWLMVGPRFGFAFGFMVALAVGLTLAMGTGVTGREIDAPQQIQINPERLVWSAPRFPDRWFCVLLCCGLGFQVVVADFVWGLVSES
jgi:energy-coupling factor transporter ATP-binding protein EcfA2